MNLYSYLFQGFPQKVMPLSHLIFLFSIFPLAYSQPILTLSESVVDLGTVQQDHSASKTLYIENDGTEPLEIFSISHASCCSIFDYILEQDIIESCERTSLTISFDPINSLGDLKELAFINSNDPEHPRIPVYIQAKVFAPLVIIPRRCVFSNPDKEQDHRTLILKMNKNEDLALSNIKVPSEALRVEIIPIEEDFILNVFLDRRKLPSGEKKQNLYIILFLDSAIESKEVKIPVIVNL